MRNFTCLIPHSLACPNHVISRVASRSRKLLNVLILKSSLSIFQLLVDEEGGGKFSYLSSHKGKPVDQQPESSQSGTLFDVSITLPKPVAQARLRLLSINGGNKGVCAIQALQCSSLNDDEVTDEHSAVTQSEAGLHSQPEPHMTQSAQVRQLLAHAIQGRLSRLKLRVRQSISPPLFSSVQRDPNLL